MIMTLLAPITLVGLLTEQGHRGCEKGVETWTNPHFQVGFHPITLAEHLSPPAPEWIGQAVVVVGEEAPEPSWAPVTDDMTCPPMQARSDWIVSKGGIRLQRERAPEPTHLEAAKVAPFTALKVRVEGEKVLISFENTLEVPIENLFITAHYEGCYGKPNALTESRVLGEVAVGAVVKAEVPARVMQEEARGREHVLHSIQVLERGHDLAMANRAVSLAVDQPARPLPPRVVFDLDLPVRDVACAPRVRKIQLEP
jgi:hypothetical protein